MCPIVKAGNVGVVVTFGNVSPVPLEEGLHLVNPLADIVQVDIKLHVHEAVYRAASSDQQNVDIKMKLNFRPSPHAVPKLYKEVGLDYEKKVIDPAAQEVLKAETALHSAGEILRKRPEIKSSVQTKMKNWLVRYDINLEEVAIAEVDFDDEYEAAIKAKQVQEQQALAKEYQLQMAKQDAEIARTNAQGQADSLRIKGQGESEYNRLVSASLTSALVEVKRVEKWDGKYPTYMGSGSGGGLFLTMPQGK